MFLSTITIFLLVTNLLVSSDNLDNLWTKLRQQRGKRTNKQKILIINWITMLNMSKFIKVSKKRRKKKRFERFLSWKLDSGLSFFIFLFKHTISKLNSSKERSCYCLSQEANLSLSLILTKLFNQFHKCFCFLNFLFVRFLCHIY